MAKRYFEVVSRASIKLEYESGVGSNFLSGNRILAPKGQVWGRFY
jgi:hypothetical protein